MFHGSRTRLIRDYRGEKRKGGICSDECSNRKHKIAADLTLTLHHNIITPLFLMHADWYMMLTNQREACHSSFMDLCENHHH